MNNMKSKVVQVNILNNTSQVIGVSDTFKEGYAMARQLNENVNMRGVLSFVSSPISDEEYNELVRNNTHVLEV